MGDKESNIQSFKIAPGMTVEEITAMFFDQAALRESPERVFRLEVGSERLYYTVQDGKPRFYLSVTNLIKRSMPTSPHLVKWIAEMGYEESKEIAQERADYGSFMHSEIAKLLIDRKLNLDEMHERLLMFMEMHDLPSGFMVHEDELKKDLLAFTQFVFDYNVKPLAIEIVLTHEDGYAGMIDLPCLLTIDEKGFFGEVYKSGPRKGEPKETKQPREVCAIVDFKSGRKGFYEENEVQLEAYQDVE